jgi:putative SOS response-associated peptidase YedK
LIPGWAKDLSKFSTLINARMETLLEKPSFRGAMRHKRCLVPADGFYEWTGKAGAKQPHLIRARANGPMAFAAIYEDWMGADGSEIESMAIITRAANATMQPIHDRMPAILPPAHFDAWLDVRGVDGPEAMGLLEAPVPDGELTISDVSRRLNNPRNEGADLLIPDRPTLL